MARYTKAVCKLCRREGVKLFLKGERCSSPKCALEKRAYAPGMHGNKQRFRRKQSDYSLQLREKQKARRIYGVFERQFRRYYRQALRRPGQTGQVLLQILEQRLDNVVYRLGFAESRAQARQLVLHGHFDVNGRKTNIPSFLVKSGDQIAVRERSRKMEFFQTQKEQMAQKRLPGWLSTDYENMAGQVLTLPERSDIDLSLNEQLIVEYYSR